MTGPRRVPDPAPGIDSDPDDDDIVGGVDDLPDDVPNGALTPSELEASAGVVADTDLDRPVEGTPLTDEEIGA